MSPKTELPSYKCHKVVQAAKIINIKMDSPSDTGGELFFDGYDSVLVDQSFIDKHDPQTGKYYVKYKDGYASISPAEAFEDGYTMEPENFFDRLLIEQKELNEKIGKLVSYLNRPRGTNEQVDKHAALLEIQLKHMKHYASALNLRIEELLEANVKPSNYKRD